MLHCSHFPKAETAASAFAMHVGVDMIVTIIVFTIVVVIAMIPVKYNNNNNTDNYGDDEDDDKQTKRPDVTELALAE